MGTASADMIIYYRPPGDGGSSSKQGRSAYLVGDFGHVMIEIVNRETGANTYLDFWRGDAKEGFKNPLLTNERRGQHYSVRIPIDASQERRMVEALRERLRSSDTYAVTGSPRTCVSGVEDVLRAGGFPVGDPTRWFTDTPAEFWQSLRGFAAENPEMFVGGRESGPQCLPEDVSDQNYSEDQATHVSLISRLDALQGGAQIQIQQSGPGQQPPLDNTTAPPEPITNQTPPNANTTDETGAEIFVGVSDTNLGEPTGDGGQPSDLGDGGAFGSGFDDLPLIAASEAMSFAPIDMSFPPLDVNSIPGVDDGGLSQVVDDGGGSWATDSGMNAFESSLPGDIPEVYAAAIDIAGEIGELADLGVSSDTGGQDAMSGDIASFDPGSDTGLAEMIDLGADGGGGSFDAGFTDDGGASGGADV
jgi:hypothetical protein